MSSNGADSNSGPLLSAQHLTCSRGDKEIFNDTSFDVRTGDVVVLTGKSGSGKSTLLKCLAHLTVYGGEVLFRGQPPKHYGIPRYRTRVLYLPQRPSMLPGTPRDFLRTISGLSARGGKKGNALDVETASDGPLQLAEAWGIEQELWDREWGQLSGGESQRIAMAVSAALDGVEILLLDEPTSALDADTSAQVEKYLINLVHSDQSSLKALIWITHSSDQAHRVGTRFLNIHDGHIEESGHGRGEP